MTPLRRWRRGQQSGRVIWLALVAAGLGGCDGGPTPRGVPLLGPAGSAPLSATPRASTPASTRSPPLAAAPDAATPSREPQPSSRPTATAPNSTRAAPADPARPPVRRTAGWESSERDPVLRQRAAALRRPEVEQLFDDARVSFPPAQLLLRGFKQEAELELWAATTADEPLVHVTTFAFCFASGELGPKRREGDGQVPEGFYAITHFHPGSSFHLALRVSYPNESDRRLGDPRAPGKDIMIHGKCVSIGCISLGDDRIEELWVATTAARDRGARVYLHIFPARDIDALLAEPRFSHHHDFWRNLQEGKSRFESRRRLPTVRVTSGGRYAFD